MGQQSAELATWEACASASVSRKEDDASIRGCEPAHSQEQVMAKLLPLRGSSSTPVTGLQHCPEVILLSFFDGIGSAALLLQSLGIKIRACFEWEVDEAAISVSSRVPVQHRIRHGDLTKDDATQLAQELKKLRGSSDCLVLATAGPPCPDYSPIKEVRRLRQALRSLRGVYSKAEREFGAPFALLVENVVLQSSADAAWFSKQLRAEPVMADGAEFGLISRPRLWWTRVNWSSCVTCPYDSDKQLRWESSQGYQKLRPHIIKDEASSIVMKGLKFHNDIVQHRKLLPCLTTPAPTDAGREPPKRMRGQIAPLVRQRWLEHQKQYAPWVYQDHALVFEESGSWQVLPAEVKEQLHHYPPGMTSAPHVKPTNRHRLLGNSWHLGIARYLLALVLLSFVQGSGSVQVPMDVRETQFDIDSLMHDAALRGIPVASNLKEHAFLAIRPCEDMQSHWEISTELQHPLLQTPRLSRALELTISGMTDKGQDLPSFRACSRHRGGEQTPPEASRNHRGVVQNLVTARCCSSHIR